jgi:hypothetical protein
LISYPQDYLQPFAFYYFFGAIVSLHSHLNGAATLPASVRKTSETPRAANFFGVKTP